MGLFLIDSEVSYLITLGFFGVSSSSLESSEESGCYLFFCFFWMPLLWELTPGTPLSSLDCVPLPTANSSALSCSESSSWNPRILLCSLSSIKSFHSQKTYISFMSGSMSQSCFAWQTLHQRCAFISVLLSLTSTHCEWEQTGQSKMVGTFAGPAFLITFLEDFLPIFCWFFSFLKF